MCYTYSLRILLLTHSVGLYLKPFTGNRDLHIYKSSRDNKQTNKQTNTKVFNSNSVNEVSIE